jgi:hypothetical protein
MPLTNPRLNFHPVATKVSRLSLTHHVDLDYSVGPKAKTPKKKKARSAIVEEVEEVVDEDPIPHCPTNPGSGSESETMKKINDPSYSYFASGNLKRTRRAKKMTIEHGYEFFILKEWDNSSGSRGRGYRPVTVGYYSPTVVLDEVNGGIGWW